MSRISNALKYLDGGGNRSTLKSEKRRVIMKKAICLLSAIMLVFAVSCGNDNPSPDVPEVPVVNAPQTNTDYSGLSNAEKVEIIDGLVQIVNDAYSLEYPALEAKINEEFDKLSTSGSQQGTFTVSNDSGTIKIVISYDAVAEESSSTTYIEGYKSKDYTIWGIQENSLVEYTFRDDTKETDNITNLKIVNGQKYYLNGEEVEYSFQP